MARRRTRRNDHRISFRQRAERVAGSRATAETKAYSFLGGILRPRPDDIVWKASGGMIAIRNYWFFDIKDRNHTLMFTEKEILTAQGETLQGFVTGIQTANGKTFREDRLGPFVLTDGCTLQVKFRPPEITPA